MKKSEHITELEKHNTSNPLFKKLLTKFAEDINKLISNLNLKEASTILDAGCGNGFLMKSLKEKNMNLQFSGLDILEESVKYAKQLNKDCKFIVGSVQAIPLKENSVDLIICSEVIEHLNNPEKALEEIKRTTKKYAIICVPHEPFFTIANLLRLKYPKTFGNYPGHIQRFGRKSLSKLLKKYFTKVSIKNSTFWLIALCEK